MLVEENITNWNIIVLKIDSNSLLAVSQKHLQILFVELQKRYRNDIFRRMTCSDKRLTPKAFMQSIITTLPAHTQKHTIALATRYTFYAERGYLPHCSTNDSLTRQQCSQGLCPQNPTTRSVSFLPTFRTTSVVVFNINVCVSLKNCKFQHGGHIGLRFSLQSGWYIPNLVQIGRTVSKLFNF